MEKKELLKELEKKFDEAKNGLGFQATFEELENVFFLKDAILSENFVSENFSRQLCSRISDTFLNWHNYLHSLLMPNPSHMTNQTESKLFNTEVERKEIWESLKKIMYLASLNSLAGISKDKKLEAQFIDESLDFWKTNFSLKMTEILRKVNGGWKGD